MNTVTLDDREQRILTLLRQNSRQSLSAISRQTGMPLSTVFDKKKSLERKCIKGYCSLLDFAKLGYGFRILYATKSRKGKDKAMLAFLMQHPKVNSISTLSDKRLLAECFFRNVKEAHEFKEMLCELADSADSANNTKSAAIEECHIIEELKRENFNCVSSTLSLLRLPCEN